MIAVTPTDDLRAATRDITWPELLQSVAVFPHDFPLVWDWDTDLDKRQDEDGDEYSVSNRVPKSSKTGLEDCLDTATRLRDVRLVLQEINRYELAARNLQEETAVLERALGSMGNLELTCPGNSGSEKEDTKELEAMVDQLIGVKGQWTLLCLAAGYGHEALVKLLLDTGKVNLDAEEWDGQTALRLAVEKGHDAVVKLLLDTGKVYLHATDRYGQTGSEWRGCTSLSASLLEAAPSWRSSCPSG